MAKERKPTKEKKKPKKDTKKGTPPPVDPKKGTSSSTIKVTCGCKGQKGGCSPIKKPGTLR